MLNITPQERQVLVFIFLALGSGGLLQSAVRASPLLRSWTSVLDGKILYPRININTADRDELIAVPYIGPKTADLILAKRPFKKLDDLRVLLGRHEENFQKMQSYLKVR